MDKQFDTVKNKLDECGATTEEHAGTSMALEPYGPSGMIPFPELLADSIFGASMTWN